MQPSAGESKSVGCRTATPGRLAGQECPACVAKPTVTLPLILRYAKRWLLAVAVVAAVAALLHHASLPKPTGPDEGVCAAGTATPRAERPTLRIGTFNIHGGKGLDGCRDLDRIAACLEGLDFAALNEVHGPRLGEPANQAQTLADTLGMSWVFAPSARVWHCLDAGNGFVSALPVGPWQRIPLVRREDRTYRNMLLVEIEHQRRTVRVVITHVCKHRTAERQAQLRAAMRLFLSLAEPAILLGDLNTTRDDPQIRALLAVPGVIDPLAEVGAANPPRDDDERIDWIFARGFRAVAAGVEDRGASDHPLVWAELAPRDEPQPTGQLAGP